MKKILMTLSLAALVAFSAAAQQNESMAFSRIDRNPATLAMGTAGFADAQTTAWSSFRNAALVPLSGNVLDIAGSWTGWMPAAPGGMSHLINAGAAYRFGGFGVTIGGVFQPGQPYQTVTAAGLPGDYFTPKDLQVNLGVGVLLVEGVSLGINAHYLSTALAPEHSYSTFSGDLSLAARFSAFTVSAGVSNLGREIKDASGNAYPVPTSGTVGAVYHQPFGSHALKASVDADYFFAGYFTAAAGVQYSFKDMLFARVGYHYATEGAVLPSFLSVGAGVQFSGFRLDVCWLTASPLLGNTLSVGLAYSL